MRCFARSDHYQTQLNLTQHNKHNTTQNKTQKQQNKYNTHVTPALQMHFFYGIILHAADNQGNCRGKGTKTKTKTKSQHEKKPITLKETWNNHKHNSYSNDTIQINVMHLCYLNKGFAV